jgi:hypothetical protein
MFVAETPSSASVVFDTACYNTTNGFRFLDDVGEKEKGGANRPLSLHPRVPGRATCHSSDRGLLTFRSPGNLVAQRNTLDIHPSHHLALPS